MEPTVQPTFDTFDALMRYLVEQQTTRFGNANFHLILPHLRSLPLVEAQELLDVVCLFADGDNGYGSWSRSWDMDD